MNTYNKTEVCAIEAITIRKHVYLHKYVAVSVYSCLLRHMFFKF